MPHEPLTAQHEAYDIDDEIVLRVEFTDALGVAGNPTTVTFRAKKPDGTLHQPGDGRMSAVSNPQTGRFEVTITPATGEDGDWYWTARGQGNGINQRTQRMFYVRPEEIDLP